MAFSKAALNYAKEYSQALAQAYPNVLYFGKLYQTENDSRYRFINGNTIEIPSITTSGRVNADRDTIAFATRNYNNAWETKTLSFRRKWSTLVHPRDIAETNQVASIQNITQVFNEFEKFPEKDKYLVSKVYGDWTTAGGQANTTALTASTILPTIDALMEAMTEARVPKSGRLLYVTPAVNTLLKGAVNRYANTTDAVLRRAITNIDEVEIIEVPSDIMKTAFVFSKTTSGGGIDTSFSGVETASTAQQINLFLVHPSAIITPETYNFAQLSEPSALSEGKWVYYEESDEDVFILNKRKGGIAFNVTVASSSSST